MRLLWRMVGVAAVSLMVACGYTDAITNAYATRAEAEEAGAMDSGWVPRGVPPSGHDLREAHNPDTHRRWGLFSFAPSDGDVLRASLEPEEISLAGVRSEPPARIEWWPLLFRRDPRPEDLKVASLKAYRAKDEPFVVVVNWNQGRAYYWSR